jgi:hypothetical protein
MRLLATLRILAVILWAVVLALLVPVFFFNYGGRWLLRLAELWPLNRP